MDSFWEEAFVYLVVLGLLQGVGVLLFSAICLAFIPRLGFRRYLARVSSFALFNALLLVWGCLGHYVWLYFTFEKFYVSVDRMVDWFPFFPFGPWVLAEDFAGSGRLLNGATIGMLRAVWAAVAIPVWLLTALSYLGIRRRLIPGLLRAASSDAGVVEEEMPVGPGHASAGHDPSTPME